MYVNSYVKFFFLIVVNWYLFSNWKLFLIVNIFEMYGDFFVIWLGVWKINCIKVFLIKYWGERFFFIDLFELYFIFVRERKDN